MLVLIKKETFHMHRCNRSVASVHALVGAPRTSPTLCATPSRRLLHSLPGNCLPFRPCLCHSISFDSFLSLCLVLNLIPYPQSSYFIFHLIRHYFHHLHFYCAWLNNRMIFLFACCYFCDITFVMANGCNYKHTSTINYHHYLYRMLMPSRVTQNTLGNALSFNITHIPIRDPTHDATLLVHDQSLSLMPLWATLLQKFLSRCFYHGSSLRHVKKNRAKK